jgi:histidine triad (HIT) family protein
MTECLFCQIVQGNIPAEKIEETAGLIAFYDIAPAAPVHFLIIPKKHITTLNDLETNDSELVGSMFLLARKLASELKISKSGYRTVFNCNRDAGQAVWHIHLHVLGGRKMTWPPG